MTLATGQASSAMTPSYDDSRICCRVLITGTQQIEAMFSFSCITEVASSFRLGCLRIRAPALHETWMLTTVDPHAMPTQTIVFVLDCSARRPWYVLAFTFCVFFPMCSIKPQTMMKKV